MACSPRSGCPEFFAEPGGDRGDEWAPALKVSSGGIYMLLSARCLLPLFGDPASSQTSPQRVMSCGFGLQSNREPATSEMLTRAGEQSEKGRGKNAGKSK